MYENELFTTQKQIDYEKTTHLLVSSGIVRSKQCLRTGKNDFDVQDKGWWLGGELGFWHSTVDDLGSNSFVLSPEVGYDFNKRWSIGVGIGYALVSTETIIGENVKADMFLFSPYARWKFCNTDRVSLFLDGGISLAGGDMDGVKIGIQPGLTVKISKHVRFQTHLGFLGYCSNYFNNAVDDSDGFGLKFSASDLKFGFYYTF